MITLHENKLSIHLPTTSPEEYRDWLIKAIAAAMRWNAHVKEDDRLKGDGEHVIMLSTLIEELVDVDRDPLRCGGSERQWEWSE